MQEIKKTAHIQQKPKHTLTNHNNKAKHKTETKAWLSAVCINSRGEIQICRFKPF